MESCVNERRDETNSYSGCWVQRAKYVNGTECTSVLIPMASPSTGSNHIHYSNPTINVTFSMKPCSIPFKEATLPSSALYQRWSVLLDGLPYIGCVVQSLICAFAIFCTLQIMNLFFSNINYSNYKTLMHNCYSINIVYVTLTCR